MKEKIKKFLDSLFWRYSANLNVELIANLEVKPFENLECFFDEQNVNIFYKNDNTKWLHKEEVIKVLEPCIIEPDYGNILYNFNHIYSNSTIYTNLNPSAPRYLNALLRNDFIELNESVIFDGGTGENYFHFFSDVFSKLWLLEKYKIDNHLPLLISKKTYNTRFFQYLLSNTEISTFNWRVLDKYVKSNLTYHIRPLPYSNDYFQKTKETITKNIIKTKYPDNIFLNRSIKSGRYIENFDEIKHILKKYDFEIFDTNEIPINEQISLFGSVKKLISIHGAGNTNILFSEPGLKFLEINPKNRISCHYYWLSSILDIDYNVILGGDLPYIGIYPEKGFYLDPVKLEKYICEWLLA